MIMRLWRELSRVIEASGIKMGLGWPDLVLICHLGPASCTKLPPDPAARCQMFGQRSCPGDGFARHAKETCHWRGCRPSAALAMAMPGPQNRPWRTPSDLATQTPARHLSHPVFSRLVQLDPPVSGQIRRMSMLRRPAKSSRPFRPGTHVCPACIAPDHQAFRRGCAALPASDRTGNTAVCRRPDKTP